MTRDAFVFKIQRELYETFHTSLHKENYVTQNTPEKFRDFRQTGPSVWSEIAFLARLKQCVQFAHWSSRLWPVLKDGKGPKFLLSQFREPSKMRKKQVFLYIFSVSFRFFLSPSRFFFLSFFVLFFPFPSFL